MSDARGNQIEMSVSFSGNLNGKKEMLNYGTGNYICRTVKNINVKGFVVT